MWIHRRTGHVAKKTRKQRVPEERNYKGNITYNITIKEIITILKKLKN